MHRYIIDIEVSYYLPDWIKSLNSFMVKPDVAKIYLEDCQKSLRGTVSQHL